MVTKNPEIRKIKAFEALFARIFRIVAGKEYFINIHWSTRRRSYSRPLHPTFMKIVLGSLAVMTLGLGCLGFELTRWVVTEARFRFAESSHHRYVRNLQEVQTSFGSVETTLDSVSHQEQKMRALYGINQLSTGTSSFGIGGRSHATASDSTLSNGLYETLFQAMLKSHQLQGKMDFTLKNLKQISEFVAYRSNLWEHTPSVAPARGERTSPFGYRVNPVTGQYVLHGGLDIAGSRWTPIYAPADGIVTLSEPSYAYGNLVMIDHGNGFHTKFGHMQRILVEKGQLVKRYSLLGYMGNTGRATGVHVHYEVIRDGVPQNPEKFILPPGLMVD
ncbi:MAG TPA: hypothetical protein DCQ83_06205 [Fibrobacteres bacterium]|jgi:murein DD-endopeptidase MepM/ murein hydrolase activator NlpD|nr:hypothetical protein [Fibrobacterota bacterium]